jgi:hypothetical protein
MARLLMLILITFLAVLSPAGMASAHTLARDGRISAFLHIAPDDKPKPGKVNIIHFYFNDKDSRFSMEGCFCDVSVKEGDHTLYKGELPTEDLSVGKINVLLPDNNFSYDVVVQGTPKTAGYFQPFKLKFDIEVGNPPPEVPREHSHWLLAAGIMVIVSAVLVILYPPLRRRTKRTSRDY